MLSLINLALVISSHFWWSCNNELYMGEYGDSCCYFWKIYRPIRIYVVHTTIIQGPKETRWYWVLTLGCLYKFRMEFYILDHCNCCCPHDHTTLYKSKSSRSGTLASTIWKKKFMSWDDYIVCYRKIQKFKGIFETKGICFSCQESIIHYNKSINLSSDLNRNWIFLPYKFCNTLLNLIL